MVNLIGSKKQQEKNKIISKLEIDESLGELLCDECEGRGSIPEKEDQFKLARMCEKCQGRGKVDWLSHITGVPPKPTGFSTSSFTSTSGNCAIPNAIVDAAAKQLADSIDKEILDNLINSTNKHIKMYDQEVQQFDNGIVSKFMFHTDT